MIRKENVLKRYIPDEAQTKKNYKNDNSKLNNRNSVNLAGAKASVS